MTALPTPAASGEDGVAADSASQASQRGRTWRSPSSSQRIAYATVTGPLPSPLPDGSPWNASRPNDAARTGRLRMGAKWPRMSSTSRAKAGPVHWAGRICGRPARRTVARATIARARAGEAGSKAGEPGARGVLRASGGTPPPGMCFGLRRRSTTGSRWRANTGMAVTVGRPDQRRVIGRSNALPRRAVRQAGGTRSPRREPCG